MKIGLLHGAALGMVLAVAACGSGGGGSGGGGSGGSGESGAVGVGGGDCVDQGSGSCLSTCFYQKCEDKGGVIADYCINAVCITAGACYGPRPEPSADEFSCDGLFNCAVGELCYVVKPSGDGCYQHLCMDLPAECAADPSCGCLKNAIMSTTCSTDAAGNATLVLWSA